MANSRRPSKKVIVCYRKTLLDIITYQVIYFRLFHLLEYWTERLGICSELFSFIKPEDQVKKIYSMWSASGVVTPGEIWYFSLLLLDKIISYICIVFYIFQSSWTYVFSFDPHNNSLYIVVVGLIGTLWGESDSATVITYM